MGELTESIQWNKLRQLSQLYEDSTYRRAEHSNEFGVNCDEVYFDYSHQHIPPQVLRQLIALAEARNVRGQMEDYFGGKPINVSESRAVLHTALRTPAEQNAALLGSEIAGNVASSLVLMEQLAHQLRTKQWLGYSGLPIQHVVNIGIGGSDLGPRLSLDALQRFNDSSLSFRFISDADPASFEDTVKHLNPAETLFIVTSKSLTTRETLFNCKKAMQWMEHPQCRHKHFIAITANKDKANALGINTVIPLWDWVGGRFSFCSGVNFVSMLAMGAEAFKAILSGAYAMDRHFKNNEFIDNMPALLALIGIWNINFRHINNHALLVYNRRLQGLVPYLQQLEMESNGKAQTKSGNGVDYHTAPIIWGGIGNQAQHAYYQLLCQGTHKVAIDFIFDESLSGELIYQFGHKKLHLLAHGYSSGDEYHIEGKMPCNVLSLNKISPYNLGAIIALYEHKVFVQGAIWGINSFDQFGVESSKKLELEIVD